MLLSGSIAAAQDKFQISFIKGLPNNHIRASAQTADGLLWLGSESGLFRYNGYQFETFGDAAKGATRISSAQVNSLLANDRLLWIGTADGLNCLNTLTGEVQTWLTGQKTAITCIALSAGGRVLAGDAGGNVYIQAGKQFRLLMRLPAYANMEPRLQNIHITGNDIAWTVQAGNIARIDMTTGAVLWEYRRLDNRIGDYFVTSFINDSHLLLSYKKEVAVINTGTFALENSKRWTQFGRQHGTFMFFKKRGRVLWITNDRNQRFFAFDQQTGQMEKIAVWSLLDAGAYMPYHLCSFDDTGFWLCSSGGLVRLSRASSFLHSISLQSSSSPQFPITTRAFFPGRGGIYLSTHVSAVLLDTVKHTIKSFSRPVFAPTATVPAAGKKLFVTSEFHGFCRYDPVTEKEEIEFYNNPNRLTIGAGLSLYRLDADKLLIGAATGLYVYSERTNTLNPPPYHEKAGRFPGKGIFAIARGPDGTIWLATQQGLYGMDNDLRLLKQYTHGSVPALKADNIRCLFISADNKLIAGTFGGGVQVIDPVMNAITSFTSLQGLPDDVIYSMAPENDSICWLGTGHGLSRFNFRSFSCKNYYRRDGLINEEFNTYSTWRAANGTIYMGVMSGLVYFDPAEINRFNKAVRIQLTGILQTGKQERRQWFAEAEQAIIKLHPSDKMLQFEFAISDITSPVDNRFQYIIEGLDNDWNYLGPQNILRIYNLPAGLFTIRIRGMAPDGSVTVNEVRIPVKVVPWFYKTVGFYLLALAVLFACLYALYRYRIRQLKKIMHLRNKIARDLHDDIGSTLSGISILSSISQKEMTNNPAKAQQQLQQIGADAREMLHNMSDIIWSVNPQHDQLEHSFVRMRQYVAQTLEAANIDVQIRFDEQLEQVTLPMETRRALYLVFKEAINNIIKYAGAGQVLIVLEKNNNNLQLLIKDNGRGFDRSQVTKGNGLKNIYQRAAEVKASVSIDSVPGKGASLLLVLPVP